jgi:hypothetical protein
VFDFVGLRIDQNQLAEWILVLVASTTYHNVVVPGADAMRMSWSYQAFVYLVGLSFFVY